MEGSASGEGGEAVPAAEPATDPAMNPAMSEPLMVELASERLDAEANPQQPVDPTEGGQSQLF